MVDHLYKRVIEAFGVLFVAVLIVLASRLLGICMGCKKTLVGTRCANRGVRTGGKYTKQR